MPNEAIKFNFENEALLFMLGKAIDMSEKHLRTLNIYSECAFGRESFLCCGQIRDYMHSRSKRMSWDFGFENLLYGLFTLK
jgi:hypothetical protein